VSRQTVNAWANRGRLADARADQAEFAERYDAAKLGPDERRLTEAETIRLIERAARKGSVGAMRMMLDQHRKERHKASLAGDDPFAALDGDPFSADPNDELTSRPRG
jgi:hypothetical protein